MLAIGALAVSGLAVRLVEVQGLDAARYASYGAQEVDQRVSIPALRGAIYDRNGNLLAASASRVDVIADDFLVTDPTAVAPAIARVLGSSEPALIDKLSEHSGYVPLAYQVTTAVEHQVAALGDSFLSFVPDTERIDPIGDLFAPLIGIVGYGAKGLSGIEYVDNGLLAGTAGSEVIPTGPDGQGLPGSASDVVNARQGTGLVLTLDEPLQFEVRKDLAARIAETHASSGIAIVEDTRTGGILAMVNLVADKDGKTVPAEQNLAATSVYQPGSVMKLVTISGALESGLIGPNSALTVPDQIEVGGWPFEDAEYHPTEQLSISQIVAQSSNVGTIEIANMLGPQRLFYYLRDLGFGQASDLDWPGESPGLVPSPYDTEQWSTSDMGAVPIGTGEAVTPIQILDAYNSVATGGIFVPPRLVEATVSPDGVQHVLPTPHTHRVLALSTTDSLLPMLEEVTQDGTATAARIPGYTVAGKTGTAQIPSTSGPGYQPGAWMATFVGFAPAQDPALTAIVVLNHPDLIYGGLASAPVFSEIMRYALRHYDIAPPTAGGPGG